VYPDSDMIMINPRDRGDRAIFRRSTAADYWDGER
jgi:hypothetical protein